MTAQIATGLIIGVVVALVSTFVSHTLVIRREREQWAREDRRQSEAWERETRAQHRADRLELYRKFLADVGKTSVMSEKGRNAWNDAEAALPEIKLLGSEEAWKAGVALFELSTNAADLEAKIHSRWDAGDHDAAEENRLELVEVRLRWIEQHETFLKATRRELGVDIA